MHTLIIINFLACFAALRSIITIELLGLDRLTDAFGLLLLIQGIATMTGAPTAGKFSKKAICNTYYDNKDKFF